jgi:hypothetical protein
LNNNYARLKVFALYKVDIVEQRVCPAVRCCLYGTALISSSSVEKHQPETTLSVNLKSKIVVLGN